jgi:hypothetical protein
MLDCIYLYVVFLICQTTTIPVEYFLIIFMKQFTAKSSIFVEDCYPQNCDLCLYHCKRRFLNSSHPKDLKYYINTFQRTVRRKFRFYIERVITRRLGKSLFQQEKRNKSIVSYLCRKTCQNYLSYFLYRFHPFLKTLDHI